MANISKEQFLDNIHSIINEGMNMDLDMEIDNSKKFNIHHYVTSLLEDGQRNPKLMTYLNNYHQFLNNNQDVKEFMVFEQFGQGLSQFAVNNKDVKRVINQMNETLDNYGHELEAYMLIEQIEDLASRDMVRNAYDNYILNEDEAARDILVDAIDMVAQEGDVIAPKLTLVITADAVNRLPKIEYGTPESKFNMIQQKIRDDRARRKMEQIQEQVDAYARKVFDEAEAEKEAARAALTFESIINNNGIDLKESIKTIANSEARSNKKLMETLNQYAGALNQGLYEERLYEGFVQNISKYNYLNPVATEIKRINEAVNQHPTSVTVTKILEEMSTTNSYYIIPLIEEDAVRFVKEPNDTNRMQLRNALCSFAGDPYCNAMLEAIESADLVGSKNTLEEKAMSIKDQAKVIRENANISAIYSPVQYIKENECVFNANGQYYVKKGNTLATLPDEYLPELSESFIALCQLVNDPRVVINENSIVLVGGDKVATIYEGYVDINGNRETTDTLRNLNEMAMKYEYFDNNFFIMASCLHENFDNIAKINFGKHIALNEDANVNIDMFRLGNNIFINTVNENIDKSTFYHNVNPIQCRNIINKHMGINVASLFEDLMPSQDKILMKLNETKNEYEASIEKYENMLDKLKKAKEECVSEDNESKLDDAIASAEKKVEDLKSEYKDWQAEVDKTVNAPDEDAEDVEDTENAEDGTEEEKSNEPIDAEDVEDAKAELSQPLSSESAAEGDGDLSDDEFNTYLDGDDAPLEGGTEVPEGSDEMDSTEVNMVHHALDGDGSENEEPDVDTMDEPMSEEPVEGGEDEDPFVEVGAEEAAPVEDIPAEAVEAPIEDEIEGEGEIDEPIDFDDDEETAQVSVPDGYKIADITFDQNLKTGELFKTGNVTVVCPMIAEDGKMFVQSDVYHFYIDETTHLPIVDAANIPVALYNAIVSSIQEAPEFAKADSEGHAAEAETEPVNTEEYMSAEDVDAASDELESGDEDKYFNFDDDEDELTISAKPEEASEAKPVEEPAAEAEPSEDGQISVKDIFDLGDEGDNTEIEIPEPAADNDAASEDVIIPSYEEDGTEIELPAPSADGSEVPEISADEVSDEDILNFDDEDEKPSDSEDVEDPKAGKDFPDYDEVEVEESLEAASEAINAAKEKLALKESKVVENRKKLVKLSAILKGGKLV